MNLIIAIIASVTAVMLFISMLITVLGFRAEFIVLLLILVVVLVWCTVTTFATMMIGKIFSRDKIAKASFFVGLVGFMLNVINWLLLYLH